MTLSLVSAGTVAAAPLPADGENPRKVTVTTYDNFQDANGYDLSDYLAKWSNPYGTGEMAAGGTRTFAEGEFRADAAPFTTAHDFSVYDHIKYLAISNQTFATPAHGSVEFSVDVTVETPGTQPGRIVRGTYSNGAPYAATTLEGQQAAATLHMIDFRTGQLFDWFVSGTSAFTLVERLPATVTGSPEGGTLPTMYTQIVDRVELEPGKHNIAIRFTRTPTDSLVEYLLDGRVVSDIEKVGIPLDVRGIRYSGSYPSLGPGELVAPRMNDLSIGHGLFSLLDAFPFQHPDAPDLHVSIPMSERLFGQGARAAFDNVVVRTTTFGAK